MKDKKYSRSDPNTVIIIDRKYIEMDISNCQKELLNKCGKLDAETFYDLSCEIINHTSGFLEGCYLNVSFRKREEQIKERDIRNKGHSKLCA